MELELEVKILEISPSEMISKIKDLGGIFVKEELQKMFIYDYPDGRLLKNNSYIRIRNENDLYYCTHKKNLSDGISEELSLQVDDVEKATQFLQILGLKEILYVEKKRIRYRKEDVLFDIDEIASLPPYLEIEGPNWQKIQNTLQLFHIPFKKAFRGGPSKFLAHYGISLDQTHRLQFPK